MPDSLHLQGETPAWLRRAAAEHEVSLLHNLRLLETIGDLTDALGQTRGHGDFLRYAALFEHEALRGGWTGRGRFLRRVLRSLAYRLFRARIFDGLPSPAPAQDPLARMPGQYARLGGGLRIWRQQSPAEAQRTPPWHDAAEAERIRGEARATWAGFAAGRPDLAYLGRLAPHRGAHGPLRLLVLLGGGGLGDALMFSAMLKALQDRFAPCEITLLFEKRVVEALYAGNPDVACAASGPWGSLHAAMLAARWAGIFDLVVDIYCFLPRYLVCEGSRLDMDRHGALLSGNHQLAEMIDRFSSNLGMAMLDRACRAHVFDILGAVGGLPLHAASPLAFAPDPSALGTLRTLDLPARFVTVRDGANPGDLAMARACGASRATKQLPPAKWVEVCAALRDLGLGIVQVGDLSDPPLDGADMDLRGRTTLSELCFLMKRAIAHVDTEGGLAHFARACNAPAIVFFGPTSDSFFGYPQNLNLSSPTCGHCWYATPDWVAKCPQCPDGTGCGMDIDLAPMRARLAALMAERERPAVIGREVTLAGERTAARRALAAGLQDWAIAEAAHWAALYLSDRAERTAGLIVRRNGAATIELRPLDLSGGAGPLDGAAPVRAAAHNIPVDAARYDVLVCCDALSGLPEPGWAVGEMLRLLRPGGLLVIAATGLVAEAAAGPSDQVLVGTLSAWLGEPAGALLDGLDAARIDRSAECLARAGASADPGAWACICLQRPAAA